SIPGQVSEIYGLDEARSIPGVRDIFPRITRGSQVKFPENNVTKCGNVISALPEREAAIEAAETAARKVWIRLAAPNKETAAFLHLDRDLGNEESPFPPSAYMLPGPLQQKLHQIPDPEIRYEKILSGALAVLPFHDFLDAPLTDYHGRSPRESLEVIRTITGLELPIVENPSNNFAILGRRFWKALVRGSYQGALYHIDELMSQAVERNR
ncbi:MAG TPA: hypothetical protein PLB48_00380, partial [Treponema sp.]|nr:hypothetical protein [Treponema sp.]HRU27457.1 hypothetical protein [Treponema sp.]